MNFGKKRELMINIGVIGCGQWGPNHIRNFSSFSNSRVAICADLNPSRLRAMQKLYRGLDTTKSYREILKRQDVQAVVIAVPSVHHYQIVRESLLAGKDVLCEKPLCLDGGDARELIRIAKSKKRILMVGHVFLFNPGVRKLRELIQKKNCGSVYYLHAERTNLGPFRTDVNSVWDLASHDVYISNYLLGMRPREVSARGGKYLQRKLDDVAFISLVYPNGVLANIHVSWLDPRKVRQITVVGDKRMMIWDDLDHAGPVKVYDRKVVHHYYNTFGEFALLAKEGDITIPKVDLAEPLKIQDAHFLECVHRRHEPLAGSGREALETVRILSAIQKSIAKGGAPVPVA